MLQLDELEAASVRETRCISEWARSRYGDPCRECGFDWSVNQAGAAGIVAAVPVRYARLLNGRDASQRHPELSWSAGGYVCHVVDNLRIWAERLAAVALGADAAVTPYDDNLLAEARGYATIPIEGALWSLGLAASDWKEAVTMATTGAVILVHPDRGEQTVLDVARTNAHDAYHHAWDIERSLQ